MKSAGGRFFGPSRAGSACVLVRASFGSVPASVQSISWIIVIWPLVTFKEVSDCIQSMLQSTALIRTLNLAEQDETLSFLTWVFCLMVVGNCMGSGTLLGTGSGGTSARVHGSRRGWTCLAVSGKGGVKCRVSSDSVSPCFCKVFQLFPPTCWWAGWLHGMENSL